MGYRSDVRIRTTKKGFEVMKQAVEKYLDEHLTEQENLLAKNGGWNYNLLKELDYEKQVGDEITIGWNCAKWYENAYKSVDAVMKSLSELENLDFPYHYIRIGEEYDDIDEIYVQTEDGYGVEYMGIIRTFDDDM